MLLIARVQEAVHKLEMGAGARFLRGAVLVLAVALVGLRYDLHGYQNMFAPEGMDAAQLARNIAQGRGYTTLFIRPFSLYLLKKHNESGASANPDFARVRSAHPDIANPPVYPLVLAGLMKVLPFHWALNFQSSFWSENGHFERYEPDFLIALFNQALLLASVGLTFFLARKLFDRPVAWLSAILVFGCGPLWRFSISGLSTMLLLLVFLALAWCIMKIEERGRDQQPSPRRLLALALSAGALAGAGALARYAFGWIIIPVVLFVVFFSGPRPMTRAVAAAGIFLAILAPWMIRNIVVSGTPFGVAGFSLVGNTTVFPGFQLERSLHPDFTFALWPTQYIVKLLNGVRGILTDDLPRFGGSWASSLFLAGLLLPFRGLPIRRMRYFLFMCLGLFIVVQALDQTRLAVISPDVNSENLLVLLIPLVFIYGVSFFFTLLDQMKLPAPEWRYVVAGAFIIVSCLPMIFTLLPPSISPVSFPPYYPPSIQTISRWMKPNELVMSDVPWAVAWYGQRQSVWLSLNAQNDFFDLNDNYKAVNALYLTPETMDARFLSDWVLPHNYSWGSFILQAITRNQIPPSFPLQKAPPGFLPEQLFLSDWARWEAPQQPPP